MSSATASRHISLDALRVLGVFGVVAIHAALIWYGDPLGFYLDEAGRFAVPMFFILSAYFWRPEYLEQPGRLALRTFQKTWMGFIAFFALNSYLAMLVDPGLQFDISPAGLFLMIWGGEPKAAYLWFLPALVVGTLLVGVSVKHLGLATTLVLSLLAYVLGCAIGAYGHVLFGQQQPIWMYRNGVLFAPLFLATGLWLRQHRATLERIPLPLLVIAAPMFLALQLAEGRFVLGLNDLGHDFGLATVPYAIAMVLLFMRLPMRWQGWTRLGRASFGAYLIHFPLLLMFDLRVLPTLPLPVVILACGAISLAISAGYHLIVERLNHSFLARASSN